MTRSISLTKVACARSFKGTRSNTRRSRESLDRQNAKAREERRKYRCPPARGISELRVRESVAIDKQTEVEYAR